MNLQIDQNSNKVINYLLVFLLIGVSGIPYFMAKPYLFGLQTHLLMLQNI